MNYYDIKLIQGGSLVGEGYGHGNNAIEAFENGFKMGTILLPPGQQVEVIASTPGSYAIKFEAAMP